MEKGEFLRGLTIFLFILITFSGLINISVFSGMFLGGGGSNGGPTSSSSSSSGEGGSSSSGEGGSSSGGEEDPSPPDGGSSSSSSSSGGSSSSSSSSGGSSSSSSSGGGGSSSSSSGGSSSGFGEEGGLESAPEGSGSYGGNSQEDEILEEPIECIPDWVCREWEGCKDGSRKRYCADLNNCENSNFNGPSMVERCVEECNENWRCLWSECSEGYTSPRCVDSNNCGTTNELPEKRRCESEIVECLPNIQCGSWSDCNVDYSLSSLGDEFFGKIDGVKSRTCNDINLCTSPIVEEKSCSLEVEIYVETLDKCDNRFTGVYDESDDELIARFEKGTSENPSFGLYFDNGVENVECGYCSDGIKNFDEEGVDCGGSCNSCEVNYISLSPSIEKSPWGKIRNFFRL